MSTVESKSEFLIDSSADRLLTHTSSEFAEFILGMAAELTNNRTEKGTPIVSACDIAEATNILCETIREGIASGKVSSEGRTALKALTQFCNLATGECSNADTANP